MADTLELQVLHLLKDRAQTLATAESCTGGLLGKRMTDLSGSSAVYPGGVISYCDEVKHRVLGVVQEDLDAYGAVSEQVARQMAEGVRRLLGSDYGVSTTGLAGPNSDGSGKPVGLVYVALATAAGTTVRELHLKGDRAAVRTQAADEALALLLESLDS